MGQYDSTLEVSGKRKEAPKRNLYIEPVAFGDMVFRFRVGLCDRVGIEVSLGGVHRFYSISTFQDFIPRLVKAFSRALKIEKEYWKERRENDADLSIDT